MKRVLSVLVAVVIVGAFSVYSEEKGLDDVPSGPGTISEATGGPDAFGYSWADQAEANCAYQFVDISGTGTDLGDGDDVSLPVTLGSGGVDFYGTTYTTVYASTNGFITTEDNGGDLTNDCPLPAPPSTGAGARMYVMHDDLDVDPECDDCAVYWEYFADCPRANDEGLSALGCDVIQWDTQHYAGGVGPFTERFQIILYETREIAMQVAECTECGESSTTGIQDETATIGLTYACNAPSSLSSSTAVCFFHPEPVPVQLQSFSTE